MQVRDVTMQNEYNIRLKDVEMADRVRDLTDSAASEREAAAVRFAILQKEKADQEQQHAAQVKELGDRQQVVIFKSYFGSIGITNEFLASLAEGKYHRLLGYCILKSSTLVCNITRSTLHCCGQTGMIMHCASARKFHDGLFG